MMPGLAGRVAGRPTAPPARLTHGAPGLTAAPGVSRTAGRRTPPDRSVHGAVVAGSDGLVGDVAGQLCSSRCIHARRVAGRCVGTGRAARRRAPAHHGRGQPVHEAPGAPGPRGALWKPSRKWRSKSASSGEPHLGATRIAPEHARSTGSSATSVQPLRTESGSSRPRASLARREEKPAQHARRARAKAFRCTRPEGSRISSFGLVEVERLAAGAPA